VAPDEAGEVEAVLVLAEEDIGKWKLKYLVSFTL